MTPAPVPAARLRAPSWRDPRLLLGLALVLASVLLGSWVVTTADRTRPVWAAAAPLAPGDAVGAPALTVVRASLGTDAARYLPADRPLPRGLVVLRTVGPGELVPRTAVGSASALALRPVGLPVTGALPPGLTKGSLVDVWVSPAPAPGAGSTAPPRQLATSAPVADVTRDEGALASRSATVHVLLDAEQLPQALSAVAAGAAVAVVLVPGSGGEG